MTEEDRVLLDFRSCATSIGNTLECPHLTLSRVNNVRKHLVRHEAVKDAAPYMNYLLHVLTCEAYRKRGIKYYGC